MTTKQPKDGGSLMNSVFASIRDMILSYQLKPGEKLVDRSLAERLGVSRTPVREALARLAECSLVVNREKRGYFVSDIDSKQAQDLYELREVLELYAVAEACLNATQQDIDELSAILHDIDKLRRKPERAGEKLVVSMRLHEVIARAGGNHALYEELTRLLHRMMVFVWIEVSHESEEGADESFVEHVKLVKRIGARDATQAIKIMRKHLRTAKKRIVSVLRAREALTPRTQPLTHSLN